MEAWLQEHQFVGIAYVVIGFVLGLIFFFWAIDWNEELSDVAMQVGFNGIFTAMIIMLWGLGLLFFAIAGTVKALLSVKRWIHNYLYRLAVARF